MTEALLDVNLLIAGVVENHADHERARLFLATLERFYTTPTIQGGFLRFLTRPWKNHLKQEQPPRLIPLRFQDDTNRNTASAFSPSPPLEERVGERRPFISC